MTKNTISFVFLYNENHQQCWWFQKALALHSPAAAEGSPVQGELSVDRLTEGLALIILDSHNPSVIFLRKCHLPLHRGG